jgi:hypothetical protein
MHVGAIFEAEDFHQRDYDAVNDALRETGDMPDGLVVHIAGPTANGWRVMGLWESAEMQRTFQEGRLDRAFDRAGVRRLRPDVFPVHATFPPVAALAPAAQQQA